MKRRKHLPEDDASTDVWYLDRYDFYLELPDGLQLKYPDFYRYYRRTQRNPSEASALASNPAEDMANESPSSDSDDAVDGDRYKADPPDNGKERPYWWPSPPERMEREIRDNMGNKWRLRRRTAIPRWNFYLPYGEDAEKYFLQKITHYIRTTAPPGRPCGRLPPIPRHHNQSRTAQTARRTHATPK